MDQGDGFGARRERLGNPVGREVPVRESQSTKIGRAPTHSTA